jgi:hypothetical protein
MANFDFDIEKYTNLLKAVSSMSKLYSDNDKAFLHSRFIEKLYVHCSNARDLSRQDMSFDAIINQNIGVGVKTFTAESIEIGKNEKVAEFTRNASLGDFKNLNHYEFAVKSSELRNKRIISDANEYSIDIDQSIYHCLVRISGAAIIHEEPYQLINIDSIEPTDSRGLKAKSFPQKNEGHVYFADKNARYRYDVAKNVLYKRFELAKYKNSNKIDLIIFDDIFEKILKWTSLDSNNQIVTNIVNGTDNLIYEDDYVILPLYSTRSVDKKEVQLKSAINQWNADGRPRSFGEAYIPIPKKIHEMYPKFFPSRDVEFKIKLPNEKIISAKVCQENNKALMSNPNVDLCEWLYVIIDKNLDIAKKRIDNRMPYSYDDLKNVGKDSVRVTKVKNKEYQYVIESSELGAYEDFITEEQL